MTLFNESRGYQHRCVVIGTEAAQLRNAFPFHMRLLYASAPDAKWKMPKAVRLSDLALKSGMVSSRKEFQRKLKERAILNEQQEPFSDDEVIDAEKPGIFLELRLGRKLLEVVIPTRISRWQQFLDWVRY